MRSPVLTNVSSSGLRLINCFIVSNSMFGGLGGGGSVIYIIFRIKSIVFVILRLCGYFMGNRQQN